LWSSRAAKSYIGLSVHFIDEEFQMKRYCLTCKPFSGGKSASNLKNLVKETLANFNIYKVAGFTTDGERSIISCVSSEDFYKEALHHVCSCHMFQLIIKDSLKNYPSTLSSNKRLCISSDGPNTFPINSRERVLNPLIFSEEYIPGDFVERENSDDESVLEEEYELDYEDSLENIWEDNKTISNLIDIGKIIVKTFRNFPSNLEVLEKYRLEFPLSGNRKYLTLKKECATRWGSAFDMLESIINNDLPLRRALKHLGIAKKSSKLPWNHWKDLSKILQEFKYWNTVIQRCEDVSFPLFIFAIFMLDKHIRDVKLSGESQFIVERFQNTLEERFYYILHHNNDEDIIKDYFISVYLDPRFSFKLLKEFFNLDLELVKKAILSELEERFPSENSINEEENSNDDFISNFYDIKDTMSFEEEIKNFEITSRIAIRGKEINNIVEAKSLEWFEKNKNLFPNLAKLARIYLGIPGSSADPERIFSKSGRIHSKERSRFLPSKVEAITFLAFNKDLL